MEILYVVMGAFLIISMLQLIATAFLANFVAKSADEIKKLTRIVRYMQEIMEDISEDEVPQKLGPIEVDEGRLVDLETPQVGYDPRFHRSE